MKYSRDNLIFSAVLMMLLFLPTVSQAGEDFQPIGPTPEGYTSREWKNFLKDAVDNGVMTNFGGLDIVVAEAPEPLVYEGPHQDIEFIGLTLDEMAEKGVVAGDFADDSTSEILKVYYHQEKPSDTGEEEYFSEDLDEVDVDLFESEAGILALIRCTAPYYCQLWNSTNGSGLVYPRNTYIKTKSKSFSSTVSVRYGEAHVNGGGDSVDLYFSGNTSYTELTTYYARRQLVYQNGFWVYIWVVTFPNTWLNEGEDAWDDIEVEGDSSISTNPISVDYVTVVHNSYGTGTESTDFTLNSSNPTHDITPAITAYRTGKLCGENHTAMKESSSRCSGFR